MTPEGPRYLRLSVTHRCDLKCVYCHPERLRAHGEEFSPRELRLLVECAAAQGVEKVRLTGGEPLQRGDLGEIIRAVSSVPGIRETTLTTNGVGLATRARRLRRAGLDRVNVSLDSLREDRFARITGRDALPRVLEGIEAAAAAFPLVKVNTVLLAGRNEDEVCDFVRFGGRTGVRVRFIEFYGKCDAATGAGTVSAEEVGARLEDEFGPMERLAGDDLSVEELYRAGGATVGLVRSLTAPPCPVCSKLRFTSAGELLPCLFAETGVRIGQWLREGRRAEIRRAIRRVYDTKTREGPRGRRVECAREIGG